MISYNEKTKTNEILFGTITIKFLWVLILVNKLRFDIPLFEAMHHNEVSLASGTYTLVMTFKLLQLIPFKQKNLF